MQVLPGYGLRIIEARRRKGWRQSDLCKAAGVSPMPVSMWENEKTNPQFESWHKLAKALEVSIEWLKTGKEASGELQSVPDDVLIREIIKRGWQVYKETSS